MKAQQTLLDIAGIVATVRPDGTLNIVRGARQYAALMGGVGALAIRRAIAQPATSEFPDTTTRARARAREEEA